MPVNPLIALGQERIDTRGPLNHLVAQKLRGEDLALRQRQIALMEDRSQREQEAIDAARNNARLESTLVGAASLGQFLDKNDVAGARAFLGQRRNALVSQGLDPSDTDEALQLLESDPTQLAAISRAARVEAVNRGLIKERDEGFTLTEGQARFDELGNEIARFDRGASTAIGKARADLEKGRITDDEFAGIVAKESGLKTPEQIQQLTQIEQIKAGINRDDEKRRLEIKKLEAEATAAEQKVGEAEDKNSRGEGLKADVARLIDDLLANPDAVRSVVGPASQALKFDIFRTGESLKAQTKINQLLNILTAENLGLMSGVLSESDIKIIQGIAAGGLDINGNEDAFIAELQRMRPSFSSGVSPSGGQDTLDGLKPVSDMSDDELEAELQERAS